MRILEGSSPGLGPDEAVRPPRLAKDSLTGLLDRGGIEERAPILIRACHELGQPISALVIDLDNFKAVNDTLGHSKGNEVIKLFADVLKRVIGARGIEAARWGGDEFYVLAPNLDGHEARALAERIQREASSEPRLELEGVGRVRCSIGIRTMHPSEELDAEGVFGQADQAMYAAKRGNTGVEVWDPGGERAAVALGAARPAVEPEEVELVARLFGNVHDPEARRLAVQEMEGLVKRKAVEDRPDLLNILREMLSSDPPVQARGLAMLRELVTRSGGVGRPELLALGQMNATTALVHRPVPELLREALNFLAVRPGEEVFDVLVHYLEKCPPDVYAQAPPINLVIGIERAGLGSKLKITLGEIWARMPADSQVRKRCDGLFHFMRTGEWRFP
jgi:diguanylate cyclase (GGDEF)-like protein